jgi:hypothetical protein
VQLLCDPKLADDQFINFDAAYAGASDRQAADGQCANCECAHGNCAQG